MEANLRNAQSSTGPKSPEGKAAVALNSLTHGLRARHAVVLVEKPAEFRELCASLCEEWQPMSHTEIDLVEKMAVTLWKQGRVEAVESAGSLQSAVVCLAFKDASEFQTEDGVVHFPSLTGKGEMVAQRLIEGISQHQGRLERSYYKALETLQRVQDRRLKKLQQQPVAAHVVAAPPRVEFVRVAAAGAAPYAQSEPDGSGPAPLAPAPQRFGGEWLHSPSGLPEGV